MRGSRLWLIMGLLVALAAAMIVAGCGDDDDEGGSTSGSESTSEIDVSNADLLTEGELLVGTDAPTPRSRSAPLRRATSAVSTRT